MSTPRFYCPSIPNCGQTVLLDVGESRHAIAARRLVVGDCVEVFDGVQTLARGAIVDVAKRQHHVSVRIAASSIVPAPTYELHLAAALPKGDRLATMLSMATQLGITEFTPMLCTRSVADPGPSAMRRWHKLVVEACKQTGRVQLPRLLQSLTLPAVLKSASQDHIKLMAHPDGAPLIQLTRIYSDASKWLIMIGPEGGFTDEEVATGRRCGAQIVRVGDTILRTETAAVAVLAVIRSTLLEASAIAHPTR